jgi:glucose-1-phosphate thymidylyltransferase
MFLPVGDITIIDTIFEDLEADDRISEVFVSTNEYFAEDFRQYIDESEFEKPTLSVEETVEEDEKFGVVGALAQLIDREGVEEDMVVVAGDNLISFDMAEFVDFFQEKETPTLAAYDVGSKERAKSYGLVELDGDRVVNFQEKPDDPNSTLVSIACYGFRAEDLPKFDEYLAGDNNPDEPGWFMQWLQRNGEVNAFTFDGAWYDIGTPESYLDAVEWALGGENHVAEGATVEDTELGSNVLVLPGSEIRDSELDRSVVFRNATITGSDIRNSIIDEETRLDNLDLSGALIGSHSRIVHDD